MNWKVFLYAQLQFLLALLQVPKALLSHGWASVPKRLLIFVIVLPLWFLLNSFHWLGFLLDELFFRAWRKQTIVKPVFIVGVPRSGTTFLQRTLALDSQFSSAPLWELVFAPSVTEKYLLQIIGKFLSPLNRFIRRKKPRFLKQMDNIHSLGLMEPEEDFLFLLPLNACFILIVLFPESAHLWRLSEFDQSFSSKQKLCILEFYKACVRKHLYFRQKMSPKAELRYLSKNPSFSPAIESLRTSFNDGYFIICMREPEIVVPSQVRSLLPAFALLASGGLPKAFNQRCIAMLKHYYQHLGIFARAYPNVPVVLNQQLRNELVATVSAVYRYLGLNCDERFLQALMQKQKNAEPSRKAHDYEIEKIDLNAQQIQQAFKDVWPIHV